jgi:DNA-binding MarR family transcriptional regulator
MKKRLKPEFDLAFEDAAESTGFLFWQLSNMWQRSFREQFEKLDLTHVQFLLLNSLATINKLEDKPVSQSALAQHSGCDKMMVSKVTRALEEKKLVMRKNHHADSRAYTILITTKGLDLLKTATLQFAMLEEEFFKPLKGKEKDVEKRIRKMLRKSK